MTQLRQSRFLVLQAGLAAALALPSYAACGQDLETPDEAAELVEEAEEIRRYSVELIVFEYADAAAGSGEIFLPDELPVEEESSDAQSGGQEPGSFVVFGDPTTPASMPEAIPEIAPEPEIDPEDVPLEEIISLSQVEMITMAPEDFALTAIQERLAGRRDYRVLLHGGWTQATVDRELAPPVRLRVLGNPPLYLDGTLTLYLSRYLHLVVDLTMESMDSAELAEPDDDFGPIVTFGDERMQNEFGYAPIAMTAPPQIRYRIEEDRIVRNGDLRYFDHPKFGVLAKVTRYEAPPEELPDPGLPDATFPPGPIE